MPRPSSRPSFAAARADHGTVRRNNLSLIVRTLRDAGPTSRARLAAETGLNKATVSSLVAELVDRGLVDEGEMERAGGVGRPGQMVGLNGQRVCGIGLELNVDYVAVLALNLRGDVLVSRRLPLDAPTVGPERVLEGMVSLLAEVVAGLEAQGSAIAGVTAGHPRSDGRRPRRAHLGPQPRLARRTAGRGRTKRLGAQRLCGTGRQRRQPLGPRGVRRWARCRHVRPRLPDR